MADSAQHTSTTSTDGKTTLRRGSSSSSLGSVRPEPSREQDSGARAPSDTAREQLGREDGDSPSAAMLPPEGGNTDEVYPSPEAMDSVHGSIHTDEAVSRGEVKYDQAPVASKQSPSFTETIVKPESDRCKEKLNGAVNSTSSGGDVEPTCLCVAGGGDIDNGDVESSSTSPPTKDVPHTEPPPRAAFPPCSEDGVMLNPFTHRIKFRFPYDYIKVAVLGPLLAPLRLVGILISVLIAYILSSIGLAGVSREEHHSRPVSGWRGYLRWGMGFSGRLMTRCYGFHVLSVKGKLASSKEAPLLVVAPHSSFFDGLACYWSNVPGLVSRIENLSLPCFGKFIDFTQPVYVWRDSTNSRQKTIQEIKNRATSKLDWPQVMVFPEGTCTNKSCLITFKPGAFYPGVPVQPIVVRYPNRMDTTTWTWDGPGALKCLWLTLSQFHNYCEIEYLPVYNPSEAEKKDAHLYASNVRAVMAKALGVPVVDYTYDDCRLMAQAKRCKLPPHIGLVEFQIIRQRFGVTLQEVEQVLASQFSVMAEQGRKEGGQATVRGLARYLGLPHTDPLVGQLFDTYDTNSRGEISFRDYLLGYYGTVRPCVTEERVRRAFDLFDTAATGRLTLEDLTKALSSSLQLTPAEVDDIYQQLDTKGTGSITYEDFLAHAGRKGEYAWLFEQYQQSVATGARRGYSRAAPLVPGKQKLE